MKIVFEGIDGSGKTSQTIRLNQFLKENLIDYGSNLEMEDRKIKSLYKELIKDSNLFPTKELSFLLSLADHKFVDDYYNDEEKIKVYDRYIYSSFSDAYALGIDVNKYSMNKNLFTVPEFIFYINITPEESLKRKEGNVSIAEAGGQYFLKKNDGKIDKAFIEFQGLVKEYYLSEFKKNNSLSKVVIIDGMKPENEIHLDVLNELNFNPR